MEDTSTNVDKFVDELRWCINQLELGLLRQSSDSRQAQETVKILKILRSTKAPLIKKRQAMRNALGDYRKKMKDEEKMSLNAMRHSRFKSSDNMKAYNKSKFLRRSHRKECVYEQDNEDNRLLSMNLNSLNLHQSVPNESSCSSIPPMIQNESSCSSHVSALGDNVVSNVSAAVNGHLNSDDQIPSSSQFSGASNFKFCPSGNSFAFNFGEMDDVNVEEKVSKTFVGTNVSDSNNKCLNDRSSEKFKFEKTDNSFSFDFSM